PRRWPTNASAVSQTVSLAQVAATECVKLWDSRPWITVEHPGRPGDYRALPEKLVASLFYIKLVTPPKLRSTPASHLIARGEVSPTAGPTHHSNCPGAA